jgi:hypothetical protein
MDCFTLTEALGFFDGCLILTTKELQSFDGLLDPNESNTIIRLLDPDESTTILKRTV